MTHKVNVRHPIRIGNLAVTGEAVQDKCDTLLTFYIAWSPEEFIEHRADQVFRRRDKAGYGYLVGKLTLDQTVVVCEVDIHFHVEGSPRGRRRDRGSGCPSHGGSETGCSRKRSCSSRCNRRSSGRSKGCSHCPSRT